MSVSCSLSLSDPLFAGSRGHPEAERNHADTAGLHEAATSAAWQRGQEAEGEAETAPAGCGE